MRAMRSEEHTSELQSPCNLVCRLLLEKKKTGAARRAPIKRPRRTRRGRSATAGACGGVRHEAGCAVRACRPAWWSHVSFFFFNDTATTEIYTLSLHDALPIYARGDSITTRSARIGPALIFQRLWQACSIDKVLTALL